MQDTLPQQSEPVYQRRTRLVEDQEGTSPGRFSWRALIAGIATAVLIAILITVVIRHKGEPPQNEPVSPQTSARDSRPAPVDESPSAAASERTASTRSRIADQSRGTAQSTSAQIEQMVMSWAESFRRKDMANEMQFYAPQLRRFYQTTNVPVSFVEQTKSNALRDAGTVRTYSIDNLNTHFDGTSAATVTFDKTWDFAGRIRHTGKVRGELKFEKHGDRWQIVSERDLKVYRQSRSRG